jgi:hypothetical protein
MLVISCSLETIHCYGMPQESGLRGNGLVQNFDGTVEAGHSFLAKA